MEHDTQRAQQFLNDLAYSSKGRIVAVGGLEGLQVYSAETAEILHQWPEAEEVWCLDVSADGKRIVTGGGTLFGKKVISLFDSDSGQLLMSSELSENIDGVAFCANGKHAVSVTFASGQLDLWDLESGESHVLRSRTTNGSHQYARRLERSPRGNLVAFAINDTIELWDVDRREVVNVLLGDGDAPCCMTFNRDGSRLFAGDAAGNIKIWNIDTDELLLTMPAHQVVSETIEKRALGVQSIALSPDGRTLATGGADGFVKLWESSIEWQVLE